MRISLGLGKMNPIVEVVTIMLELELELVVKKTNNKFFFLYFFPGWTLFLSAELT